MCLRPDMQGVELGDGAGDHVVGWPPQQRGVCALQLQPGLHRLHLLHQGVGHPRLGQVHPHPLVSVSSWVKAPAERVQHVTV